MRESGVIEERAGEGERERDKGGGEFRSFRVINIRSGNGDRI